VHGRQHGDIVRSLSVIRGLIPNSYRYCNTLSLVSLIMTPFKNDLQQRDELLEVGVQNIKKHIDKVYQIHVLVL
jgi:hypothetical protein